MKRIFLLFFLSSFSLFSLFSQEVVTITVDGLSVTAEYAIPQGEYMAVQPDFFYLRLKENPWFTFSFHGYPEEDKISGTAFLTGELIPLPGLKGGKYSLEFEAGFQYCDASGACFFPQKEMKTLSVSLEGEGTGSFLLKFLLLALLGGLLLNVMPCVLPVLSIKALSLVKQAGQERSSLMKHAFLYAGGIITSLTVLALTVILIKLSGEAVGWGFQFQNPLFVMVLLALIFLFALSLFEVFFISLPGVGAGRFSGKKGYGGSFFSGVFAVILATPCTAPFLGTALGFAFAQPPFIILLIFIFIGLGLSLPFLLLAFFPGFVRLIPRPGEWMNTFRVIMGFLLMATAVWLLDVLGRQVGDMTPVYILLLLLALAAWIYGRFAVSASSGKKAALALFLALSLAVGGFFQAGYSLKQSEGREYQVEDSFSEETLLTLLASGEKVFVEFSAAWCMTCRVNEKAVLNTKEIRELFDREGVVVLKGDFTNKNPLLLTFMEKYGRAGVPFYGYFEGERAEILPEIITKEHITDLFSAP